MITTELKDRTITALQNRPAKLKLKDISEATGVPLGWLKMLHRNKIADPGVCRTQTIYEYLVGKVFN